MKKLLLVANLVLLTLSCSSSDDNSSNNSNINSKITPPAWIQGSWEREDVPNMGYTFYKDDLCNFIGGGQYCKKEYINLYQGTGVLINVTQDISDTNYKCSITVALETSNYHFQKIDTNTIRVIEEPGSNTPIILKRK